jgi:hypothetical protein
LNVSLGIGNHLLCIPYTKSGKTMYIKLQKINSTPFMIVHHMKKVVSIRISMMVLLISGAAPCDGAPHWDLL